MLTRKIYLTSHGKYPRFEADFASLPEDTQEQYGKSMSALLGKVSEMLARINVNVAQVRVTSGWRPLAHNKAIGGSDKSHHIYCRAIDLWDPDKSIGRRSEQNIEAMRELGLYMESLKKTHEGSEPSKWWAHYQIVAPRSGNIIFLP